mmetsp:Transcript_103/g.188  ORF Transcript_103/g.188 Transcript_103/m.188 type:complete len:480 (-) Transcript_103:1165-2604(-)
MEELNTLKKFENPPSNRPNIQPVSPFFSCSCSLCNMQSKNKVPKVSLEQKKEDFANYQGKQKSFTWVLKQLGEASLQNSIKLNVPETVVYRKGKPSFMICQNKDNFLKYVNSPQKLKNSELRKSIINIVKIRKKEGNNDKSEDAKYGKETVLLRYMAKEKDNNSSKVLPHEEEGALRVMFDYDFVNLMYERPSSFVWKSFTYFQTCVKCQGGIGETFTVTYYSHEANDQESLHALQHAGQVQSEEEEALTSQDPHQYCLLMCRRIVYNLATFSQKEVLRMRAEFMQDDNSKIWFTYASRISVRKITLEHSEKELMFKRVPLMNPENKQELLENLSRFRKCRKKSEFSKKVSSFMDSHYKHLKQETGVQELFGPQKSRLISSEAFAVLRPMIPYDLKQLMDPKALQELGHKSNFQSKKSRFSMVQTPHRKTKRNTNSSISPQKDWVYNPRFKRSVPKKMTVSSSLPKLKISVTKTHNFAS